MAADDRSRPAGLDGMLSRAEQILTTNWGFTVRLGACERMTKPDHRNLLLRVRVADGPPGGPASVIIKQAEKSGYDPDDPNCWAAVGLFREWAALEFLAGLDAKPPVECPKLFGGDRLAGFFVTQDLDGADDLDHVLTCGSAHRAEASLVLLAEALGRLHAATVGREDDFHRIRDRLGPGDRGHRGDMAEHVRRFAPELAKCCCQLGFAPPDSFFEDVASVAAAMENPGPFLAFTHGDPCPDNSFLPDGRLVLIDFEFSGFRHALLDGVYGRLRFPTCWCVRDIPEAVVESMDVVYRRELARGCPAAQDDGLYHRAVADAGGYWVLENLAHLLDGALEYEQPKGTSTNRQRLLMRLAAFVHVAQCSGHLPGLLQTMSELLGQLQKRWTDDRPRYDAFDQPADVQGEEVAAVGEAIRSGNVETVRQMLQRKPGLAKGKLAGADQVPLLFLAVESKQATAVRLLLEHGADWRVTTRSGWTVLAKACGESTPEIVDLLLQRGADLNARDSWGSLPIYGAVGNEEMFGFLIARGAELDVKAAFDLGRLDLARQLLQEDPQRARFCFGTGVTLLHDLARVADENLEAMQLLLEAGADVNARTNWQATPLHLAAFNGRARTVEFLLEHGAEINPQDNRAKTPLGLAVERRHNACAELLRRHGGVNGQRR